MGEVKGEEPLGAMPSSGRLTATIRLWPRFTVDGADTATPSVQIIPSVLPADWANMGAEWRLEARRQDTVCVMDGTVRT